MKKKVRQILTLWQDSSVISWLKSLPGNQTHGNYLFEKSVLLGKFFTSWDAYEDVEKDIGNNSYNPLKEAFAKNSRTVRHRMPHSSDHDDGRMFQRI